MNQVQSPLLREPDDEATRLAVAKDEFGQSATPCYQVINQLLDAPEALAAAPQALQRYARLREMRPAWRRQRG